MSEGSDSSLGVSVLTVRLELGKLAPSLVLQVFRGRVRGALREVYAVLDALVVGVDHVVGLCCLDGGVQGLESFGLCFLS